MGWKETPGDFCLASETVCDIAAEFAGLNRNNHEMPLHKFEKFIKIPEPPAEEAATRSKSGRAVPWVFVYGFIAMSQNLDRMWHTTRAISTESKKSSPARQSQAMLRDAHQSLIRNQAQ